MKTALHLILAKIIAAMGYYCDDTFGCCNGFFIALD
jgi:hypothetical protein